MFSLKRTFEVRLLGRMFPCRLHPELKELLYLDVLSGVNGWGHSKRCSPCLLQAGSSQVVRNGLPRPSVGYKRCFPCLMHVRLNMGSSCGLLEMLFLRVAVIIHPQRSCKL